MHELSIAEELLDIIIHRARDEHIGSVNTINLRIGRYSGILPDCLTFAFEMLSKDTVAEEARVFVEETEGNELQILSFEGD